METKKCVYCKETKDIEQFHTKGKENRRNSWCKLCVYESQRNRWRDRKRKAVELLGGRCSICGYNKNLSCLDFHHVNPSEKEFDWKKLRLKKWEDIITEIKKCICVCRNCHGEIHNPTHSLTTSNGNDNNNLNLLPYEISPTGSCPSCQKDVYGTKYCSTKCSAKGNRKVKRPSKDMLKTLLEESNFSAIGREYGVSDNSVRKWAKSYSLF